MRLREQAKANSRDRDDDGDNASERRLYDVAAPARRCVNADAESDNNGIHYASLAAARQRHKTPEVRSNDALSPCVYSIRRPLHLSGRLRTLSLFLSFSLLYTERRLSVAHAPSSSATERKPDSFCRSPSARQNK